MQHVDEGRNHWWWRPGWRAGRHFYACHLTPADQPELRRLVDTYQAALRDVPTVDLIPAQWLHLTMQGIGFTDEISSQEIERILAFAGGGSRLLALVRTECVSNGGMEAVKRLKATDSVRAGLYLYLSCWDEAHSTADAVENPDGQQVLVATNPGPARTIELRLGTMAATVSLKADSVTTLAWK